MKILCLKSISNGLLKFNLHLNEGCIVNGWVFRPATRSILAPRWPTGAKRQIVVGNKAFWRKLQDALKVAVEEPSTGDVEGEQISGNVSLEPSQPEGDGSQPASPIEGSSVDTV